MIVRELNDLAQADWFMLYMQPMSLLPRIYMAGYIHLRFLQHASEFLWNPPPSPATPV